MQRLSLFCSEDEGREVTPKFLYSELSIGNGKEKLQTLHSWPKDRK